MTLSRLILILLVVGAAIAGVIALRSVHPPANAPGVSGLTNAIHAAQGAVQQSQSQDPSAGQP